jgi:hypothetical protein
MRQPLLALPAIEAPLIQPWTLSPADLDIRLAAHQSHRRLSLEYRYRRGSGRVPAISLGSNKPAAGRCRLSAFSIRSSLPSYPARFMHPLTRASRWQTSRGYEIV